MAAIKASTLTGGSLISATKASPPPAPTLVEGVPISGGARGATTTTLMRMTTALTRGSLMSSEIVPGTLSGMSTACLGALGITVKPDSDPSFSLMRENKDTIDNPRILNPSVLSEAKEKDFGDDMFPSVTDPFYEMDENPPQYIEDQLEASKKAALAAIDPSALAAEIFKFSAALPGEFKMKQLK